MAWLAVDQNEDEYIYEVEPIRDIKVWICGGDKCHIPEGSIEKLIGSKLTWNDEPVELT